jgi:hypothetical protein
MIFAHPFLNYPHFVILNLFQDNKPPSRVMLKQVQHNEILKL